MHEFNKFSVGFNLSTYFRLSILWPREIFHLKWLIQQKPLSTSPSRSIHISFFLTFYISLAFPQHPIYLVRCFTFAKFFLCGLIDQMSLCNIAYKFAMFTLTAPKLAHVTLNTMLEFLIYSSCRYDNSHLMRFYFRLHDSQPTAVLDKNLFSLCLSCCVLCLVYFVVWGAPFTWYSNT